MLWDLRALSNEFPAIISLLFFPLDSPFLFSFIVNCFECENNKKSLPIPLSIKYTSCISVVRTRFLLLKQ